MKIDKKVRSVRLKDKDILLFDFIAKFGFATVEQLHLYLGGSINSLKTRLSHLVNDGYLLNHRIFFHRPSVYTVTAKGNQTELGLVKVINLRDYEHDLLVIDVFLKLRDRFVGYDSEKMIRAARGIGVGKSGRIPDLIGYTSEGDAIAIEVDRTDKSLDRLKSIVVSYATAHQYSEVWFICGNQLIFNNMEKVGYDNKIKLFHLKDVIAGNLPIYVSRPRDIPKELAKFFKEELPIRESVNEAKATTVEAEVSEEILEREEKRSKLFGNFRF